MRQHAHESSSEGGCRRSLIRNLFFANTTHTHRILLRFRRDYRPVARGLRVRLPTAHLLYVLFFVMWFFVSFYRRNVGDSTAAVAKARGGAGGMAPGMAGGYGGVAGGSPSVSPSAPPSEYVEETYLCPLTLEVGDVCMVIRIRPSCACFLFQEIA